MCMGLSRGLKARADPAGLKPNGRKLRHAAQIVAGFMKHSTRSPNTQLNGSTHAGVSFDGLFTQVLTA